MFSKYKVACLLPVNVLKEKQPVRSSVQNTGKKLYPRTISSINGNNRLRNKYT